MNSMDFDGEAVAPGDTGRSPLASPQLLDIEIFDAVFE